MKSWILTLGVLGVLILVFALHRREGKEVYAIQDDDELNLELYAQ